MNRTELENYISETFRTAEAELSKPILREISSKMGMPTQ